MANKKDSLTIAILRGIFETVGTLIILSSYRSVKNYVHYGEWPDIYYNQTLRRMEKRGLVKSRKVGPNIEIRITKKGINLFKRKGAGLKILKPKKWDRKWRFVIFDIPEDKREARDTFRDALKALEFEHIQKSVWVLPYPCRNEILRLCEDLEVSDYATLIEGNFAGSDGVLRDLFDL